MTTRLLRTRSQPQARLLGVAFFVLGYLLLHWRLRSPLAATEHEFLPVAIPFVGLAAGQLLLALGLLLILLGRCDLLRKVPRGRDQPLTRLFTLLAVAGLSAVVWVLQLSLHAR